MKTKAREMEQKLRKAQFGFDDYLESMNQMKNMGGYLKDSEHDARHRRSTDEAAGGCGGRKADGADRSNHSFHDTKGKSKSGSSESIAENAELQTEPVWISEKSTSW